jgi:tetratricopeptide (TPR) repeat protein
MSANEADVTLCASCGIAAGDDIKLKKCACKLVKYCSVKCQKDHRPKHKKECKKRVADLRDEILFKQPEITHLGDCPICCLPLPIDSSKSNFMYCCNKLICQGCNYARQKREVEWNLQSKCPFCREPLPITQEEINERVMKRIEANDPVAISHIGKKRCEEEDYEAAFEYFTRAAELGDVDAHFQLAWLYREGNGVENDEKKVLHHLEEAAIGGHPSSRCNLGALEAENGQYDRAVNHFIIAAKLGDDISLGNVKELDRVGCVSEEDFASALRGHKAAIDATKSPQREEAYDFFVRLAAVRDGKRI